MNIDKLIENISSGKYSEKELINLFNNVSSSTKTSEYDKERLVSEIEVQTRLRFPKSAKKIFGAKGEKARELLGRFYEDLNGRYSLTENKLKNGVKTGGNMLAGRFHVDVYISYKNISSNGASMALVQEKPDSELVARVRRYRTNCPESGNLDYREFGIDDLQAALATYEGYLDELLHS